MGKLNLQAPFPGCGTAPKNLQDQIGAIDNFCLPGALQIALLARRQIMVNDDERVFTVTARLMDAGVYLNPVRYPAVKRGRARLRVSVSAAHDPSELEQAADRIAEVLDEQGVLA